MKGIGSNFNMLKKEKQSILLLPDIRSALNVGAIFRTADAIGIDKMYLIGTTSCPNDKFGRIQKDIAKSALGAEQYVSWEYKKSLLALISKLRRDGFTIIALEQDEKSVDYRKVKNTFKNKKLPDKVAIVLGQETIGLDKKVISLCDIIAEIPMHGKKESLNVSVATGVLLFELLH